MANPKVIQIPVELQTSLKNQASNLQKLYKKYQGMFDRVDPGSAFAKSIAKSFSKIEGKFNLADGLLGKEFFSQADLNKVVAAMGAISDIMSEIQARAQGTSLTTLGLDTTKVDEARQRLTDLQKQIRSLKNEKVGSILGANSKDLQEFASLSKTTGFSGGKSYAENYRSMAAAVGNLNQEYGRLTIEADNAKKALDAANSAAAQAKVDLNMAEGALQGRRLLNEDVANKFMAVKVSGKGATRESIIQQYQDLLDEQLSGGTWIEGGENFAQIVAGWLNISEGELSGTAEQIVANLKSAISTAMKGGPLASNILRTNAKSVLNQEQDALRRDVGYIKAEEQVQLAAANVTATGDAAQDAVNTLTAATHTVDQTKLLLDQVISQMERLKTLQDAYNKSVDKTYESQVNEARQDVANARRDAYEPFGKELEQHTKNAQQAAHEAQVSQNKLEDSNRAREQQDRAAERRAQEAQQFSENLKQSVRHWMSAQQIINIVKNGIRQAVQDIKSLDSAMSNIAVVTDMSISDLWGKINDYMAIAKQYGVTTQGVYEVSQLYYQQGLATAEVMELTTETLKLARVANMDYKDSADAMTVALRGFKMEMSEAATVTDVYSKVAAVTASDQAELAVAMSKTASSAASVGSSFENTTAMLAVMVETTRESAQNLGSALKSIISRYGEMKSGLTQDSEGEIIDYNKVDTALRSVGISIKDAQGQFRDFDDVIFELSEAWDGLDKNTQRYIATIMAGNRQQSRFIALVDNYERLKEVQEAAENSEDAGLLQYAKTLDSLETKLNNIKTSFQQFYMNIVNGPVISTALEWINKLIEGLNRMGSLSGIFSMFSIIKGLKAGLTFIVNAFSNSYGQIISDWRATQKKWLEEVKIGAYKRGQTDAEYELQGYNDRINGKDRTIVSDDDNKAKGSWITDKYSNKYQGLTTGLSVGGGIASGLGAFASANGKLGLAAGLNTAGSTMTGASIGAALGPYGMLAGAIIGGVGGALANYIGLAEKKAQALIDEAQKAAEEANIERAQKKEEYRTLDEYVKKLQEAEEIRNDSEESYQEWLTLNNEIAEKYPELISYIDAEGNSIVQLTEDYEGLAQARKQSFEASRDYWKKQIESIRTEIDTYGNTEISRGLGLLDSKISTGYEGFETLQQVMAGTESVKLNSGDANIEAVQDYLETLFQSGIIDKNQQQEYNKVWYGLQSYRADLHSSKNQEIFNNENEERLGKLYERAYQISSLPSTLSGLIEFGRKNEAFNISSRYQSLKYNYLDDNGKFDENKLQEFGTDIDKFFYDNYRNLFDVDKYGQLILTNIGEQGVKFSKNFSLLKEYQETYLSQTISELFSFSESADLLGDVEGIERLLTSIGKIRANGDIEGYADTLTLDNFNLEEEISNLYKSWGLIKKELFESLASDLDSFSFNEIETNLTNLDFAEEENKEIFDAFKLMYAEQFSGTYRRIAENLIPNLDLLSFDEWSKEEENENKTEAQYLEEYLRGAIENNNQIDGSLQNILLASSIEELEAYNKFHEENERLIENSSGQQKKIAQARASAFKIAFDEFINEGTVFGINMEELDKAQQTALWELLNADDKGTYDWKYRLEAFAKETGQSLDYINHLVYENINTRIERIFDSADETVKELENFTKKQEDGFELQEARAFASKIGKRMDEVFEFKDGKLIISDYGKYITEYYDASIKEVEDLNSDYLAVLENFAQKDYSTTIREGIWSSIKNDKDYSSILDGVEHVSTEVEDLLVAVVGTGNKELQDYVVAWAAENQNANEEAINAMLEELYAAGIITKQELDSARETSISNAAFNDFIKETESAFDNLTISYQNFKENFQLLSPNSEIPDTAEEWADWFNNSLGFIDFRTGLITDFDAAEAFAEGLGDENATKWMTDLIEAQIGSSFDKLRMGETLYTDVDKTSAKEALQTLGIKSQELIDNLLEDNIISAEESLLLIFANNQEGETLVQTAERIGADFNEIIENMVGLPGQIVAALGGSSALTPEMRDTINEVRNTLYDNITGLLGGTGTWDQATKLQTAVGTDVNLEFIETSQGIRLLTNSIGNLMEALSSDNSALYAQTFTEISQNIQTYYPHLENVYDIIEEIGELQEEIDEAREQKDEERIKSLEQQKRLLETAARYQSNMAGSKGFDFMSSNLPGNAENYLTYIENIGSAQEALQGLASSGTIDAASLMRMFQFAEAENGVLPGGANWTDIYAAVSTASPDGTISAESLYELFGVSSQADLAQAIADAMREADISFREKQAKIQDEITQEKQWLSSASGIEENWEKIVGGEAPLTVRMDGEPIKEMTDTMAVELAAKWAALSEGEQKQILDTGVWEISTIDQTVQEAADTLTSIEEKIDQIITGAVGTNLYEKADRLTRDAEAYEAASFEYSLNPTKAAEEAMVAAQQAYNQSLDEFNVAKAEFDAIVGNVVTPNIQINKEKLYSDLVSATKRPITLNIIPKFFAVPGLWTGNVNGLALAEGNATSKLIAGAALANKTLIGELGPELAVYNGQYHLLGQNGAEFVNLPSDAIVFNHKQTEGIAKGQMGIRGKAMSDGNLAELWKLYVNDRNATGGWDITSGSGGGGKSYDFAEEEGEEWYNYLRRIAKLEQEINQLEAERENIVDGGAYLRNLRETQTIYQEMLITQQQLLDYQKAQLELERKQIEEKWGNVLTFTNEGLSQYVFGNETNGGKGILNILELFNSMSGAEQVAKVKELGYSYTDQNGKKLEGEELVQKFLEELTGDYEHYDDLYDSVAEATTELEDFKKAIKDIEDEIRDNRIELEEKIYDLVVEGWEKNIEKMQDELDLLSEANERYINGLSESLQKERDLYDKDSAIADREQLQRRLSLLRRSGGAASEIASLEEQLNDTLKDEYFQHQQDAIDEIAKANETQIDKLEQQIRIQEEQLEFSKEHGLIWQDVNAIMAGTSEDILAFIQGNDTSFIIESVAQQEKMLEEWAKKIGIFTEDRQHEVYTKEATENFSAETLNSKAFDKADEETKKKYTDQFARYFADARVDGKSTNEAYAYAYDELRKLLNGNDGNGTGTSSGGSGGGNTSGTTIESEKPKEITLWKFTFNGKEIRGYNSEANAKARIESEAAELYGQRDPGVPLPVHTKKVNAIKAAALASLSKYTVAYSKGGLVDYTGLAMVHGSKSRPEGFLNADQTAMIRDALKNQGESAALNGLRTSIMEIAAAAKTLVSNETRNESSVTIAPGAVVVKVEQLNDKYDIDAVADDIMNKMVSIASRTTNRGVNRR